MTGATGTRLWDQQQTAGRNHVDPTTGTAHLRDLEVLLVREVKHRGI